MCAKVLTERSFNMSESKYAEILRARGFVQMPPILINGNPEPCSPDRPRFSMMSQFDATHAVDELGGVWMKQGLVSLSDLDFEDISRFAQAVINVFSAVEVDGERFEIPKIQ